MNARAAPRTAALAGVPAAAWWLPVACAALAGWAWGDAMTYAQFHLGFTLPWLALFATDAAVAVRAGRPLAGRSGTRGPLVALGALAVVAFGYTFPWDHHLVASGVWGYPPGRVAATLGVVPVEEAAFFLIQTLATGSFVLWFARRVPDRAADGPPPAPAWVARGVPALVALGAAAAGLLLLDHARGTYLGLILVWAAPVLALQWGFGGDLLLARWRRFALAAGLPTLWLWVADRIAIGWSIWWISPERTVGWRPWGLPVEEAVFFAVTNLLVVGGMMLATDGRALARLGALAHAARRRPWRPLLALWVMAMVPTPLLPDRFLPLAYLSTGALVAAVLAYALARFGARAWPVLGVSVAFGWAVEVLGSHTGVPFGAYAYAAPGPALATVPLLVPLGWFAFTLIALAVAAGPWVRWLAPAALVAWDLGLDPLMVREGFWAFARGGYFGVPWTNFVGWYVAGFALMALLRALEPRLGRVGAGDEDDDLRTTYLVQAFLIGVGLASFGMPLAGAAAAVAMLGVALLGRAARRRAAPRAT